MEIIFYPKGTKERPKQARIRKYIALFEWFDTYFRPNVDYTIYII
jgi:hypothetical protein